MQKKATKRGQAGASRSRPTAGKSRPSPRPSRPARRVPEAPPPAPVALDTSPVPLSVPERQMAARVPPAEPDRPVPVGRRAIFFDVENSSRADHVDRVLTHLAVDRVSRRTELIAVGNWKVIGQDTARLLARKGAALVHSAPSTGVRDWSDLRIAIAAGVWLASARPGDVIEIISDDRAFDAVGDVAAGLGIDYRRLSFRSLAGVQREEAAAPPPVQDVRSRRRRRGRRHGGARPIPSHAPAPPPAVAARVAAALPATPTGGNGNAPAAEPHTAPADEIVSVVRGLIESSPGRVVTIDAVANTLKARGFSRPPGSPRLITRLRRIRQIAVSRNGMIAFVEGAEFDPPPPAEAPEPEDIGVPAPDGDQGAESDEPSAASDDQTGGTTAPRRGRRRSRRGGRRHRRGPRPADAPAPGD